METAEEIVCLRCQSGLARALFPTEPQRVEPVLSYTLTIRRGQSVAFWSEGIRIAGKLFLPESPDPAPVVIICHGAGDWKENYYELCEYLAERGLGAFAVDLRGHGQSGGERFCVDMRHWVADIRAAIDYVSNHPRVDCNRIAAFGLSSGGTAILEAALVDGRLKVLVALDATVRNSLPRSATVILKTLLLVGRLKQWITKKPLRVPLARLPMPNVASDPDINRRILAHPPSLEAMRAFPLPGAEQSFFMDTLERASKIRVPTLVLWGEDDQVDPPTTARMLYETLTCKKRLEIIPGNGHVGHLDRNRDRVFHLTSSWVWQSLSGESVSSSAVPSVRALESTAPVHLPRTIPREEKWKLLSPFLKRYGREGLAYATLQEGLEYFLDHTGFIAYTTVRHPVFARRPKRIVLSDPVCAPENLEKILRAFLREDPRGVFGVISERCAEVLRPMGFKVNCLGYEPLLPVQTFNTQGNWKELDLIKRARNEARREGLVIREETGAALCRLQPELAGLSRKWVRAKKINDREIWIYARRPIFDHEEGVRKFLAYEQEWRGGRVCFLRPDVPGWRGVRVFSQHRAL